MRRTCAAREPQSEESKSRDEHGTDRPVSGREKRRAEGGEEIGWERKGEGKRDERGKREGERDTPDKWSVVLIHKTKHTLTKIFSME